MAMTASSSSSLRTVDCGSFGPIFASSTVSRFRHLATVFTFIPISQLNAAVVASESSIVDLIACVAGAYLPHITSFHSNEWIAPSNMGSNT